MLSSSPRSRCSRRCFAVASIAFLSIFVQKLGANPDLVDIKTIAPSIVIDLRYATSHNVTGRALYPPEMPALIRPSVAQQLLGAQNYLHQFRYGLKIWDAYRPKEAQLLLWRLAHKEDYVANPESGFGSMHYWGVSVDATLVDDSGRLVTMPTDFDEFTPAAMMRYQGTDPLVKAHLRLLQIAMARNNFYGLRTEWWHFTTADWQKYVPYQEFEAAARTTPAPRTRSKVPRQ